MGTDLYHQVTCERCGGRTTHSESGREWCSSCGAELLPKPARPAPDEIERVARRLFEIGHLAARESVRRETPHIEKDWEDKWDDVEKGYRAGWVAIAKAYLTRSVVVDTVDEPNQGAGRRVLR